MRSELEELLRLRRELREHSALDELRKHPHDPVETLLPKSVTADLLAEEYLTDVPANSVGTAELANDAVTSAKISDGTITAADLGLTWQAWVPTYTGFSVDPTNTVSRYMQLGKLVIAHHREATAGTSNAAGFTISAPVTAATITNAQWHVTAAVTDSGIAQATPGVVLISSGGTSFSVTKDGAGTAFTNAGGKRVSAFVLIYEAA